MKKNHLSFLTCYLLLLSVSMCTYVVHAQSSTPTSVGITGHDEWELVWSDEFDMDGTPDPSVWTAEEGFQRNNELQWYQADNAFCENGVLKLQGRREQVPNPNYDPWSWDWKLNREYAEYTSGSITTGNHKTWLYGRFEIRAKIPVDLGAWPAIWTIGLDGEWPSNGEIDLMEYYLIGGVPHIMANLAWGTEQQWIAKWAGESYPYTEITGGNEQWADEFHIWRMDWDEHFIRLYLDDRLLNEVDLTTTVNPNGFNPFHQPHYILLNLALGSNGGNPADTQFPLTYEVDYVRIYQKKKEEVQTVITPVAGQIYNIMHFSGNFLTDNGLNANAKIVKPTGAADQQFRFVPVPNQSGLYYIQQVSTGLYLYRHTQNNIWETRWTENPENPSLQGYSRFEVVPVGEKEYIMLKVNGGLLGTDHYEKDTPVYSDKWKINIPTVYWEIQQSTSGVGKIALKNLIAEVKNFLVTAISGGEEGQYPTTIYNDLVNELSGAELLFANQDATQLQVDNKTQSLEVALLLCRSSLNLVGNDINKVYNIIHSSGNYLGVKSANAGIFSPTDDETLQFKFIPVTGYAETYNILHALSGRYLTKSGWNIIWGNDPTLSAAKLKLIRTGSDKIKIRFEETGTPETARYLGTDNLNANAYVFADKSGNEWKHLWNISEVKNSPVFNPDETSIYRIFSKIGDWYMNNHSDNIQRTTLTLSETQLYRFEKVAGYSNVYLIKSNNNKYVLARNWDSSSTADVWLSETVSEDNYWIVEYAETVNGVDYFTFYNSNRSRYMRFEPEYEGGKVRGGIMNDDASKIAIVKNNAFSPETETAYRIFSKIGDWYMNNHSDNIQRTTLTLSETQLYRFEKVAGYDNVYLIKSNNNKYVLARSWDSSSTADVWLSETVSEDNHWIIEYAETVNGIDYFSFYNSNRSRYMRFEPEYEGGKVRGGIMNDDASKIAITITGIPLKSNTFKVFDNFEETEYTDIDSLPVSVYTSHNTLHINNLQGINRIAVYSLSGMLVSSKENHENNFKQYLPAGSYVLSITGNSRQQRVIIIP